MRFQLRTDYPVGQYIVPADTIIDSDNPTYLGSIPIPFPLSRDVVALDQEAADQLSRWHPHDLHLLHAKSPAVIRKPCRIPSSKADKNGPACGSLSAFDDRKPIRRIRSIRCARTGRDRAATAPPTSVMNSRRRILDPKLRRSALYPLKRVL